MDKKVRISRMTDIKQQNNISGNNYEFCRHKFIRGEEGFKSNIAFYVFHLRKLPFPCIITNTVKKLFILYRVRVDYYSKMVSMRFVINLIRVCN